MNELHPIALAFQNVSLSVWKHSFELIIALLGGVLAYIITNHCMQQARMKLLACKISGIDINKTTAEQRRKIASKRYDELEDSEKQLVIPESLGILAGAVYLCVLLLILILAFGPAMREMDGAVTTITIMLLLGFVDDVLDVRWRHKLLLSAFGSLPLIMTYKGSFSVAVPRPLLSLFGGVSVIYLGGFYFIYLSLLCVFCTNSINILAGVNGVEVGQSIVIAIACIIHNIIQLRLENEPSRSTKESTQQQLLAIALLIPFVGVSLALWRYNKYPARIFLGDSYTYFAGTVLAVAGVTGLYGKTLMLFIIPQIINFILSLPQLFHIIPCPRHRVPRWDPKRNVLQNSGNYTLLNAILWFCGDMHEHTLTMNLLKVQVCCCILGFLARYLFASYMYDQVD